MDKVPTAEEFAHLTQHDIIDYREEDTEPYLVTDKYAEKLAEFAKVHVRAQKEAFFKEILKEGLLTKAGISYLDNAYPEDNIK